VELLGVRVDPMTIAELHDVIARAVADRQRWVIAHHNLHSLYLQESDAKMRALYERAHRAHVDGMSLVLLGRLLGHRGLSRDQRVTYVDWVRPLMRFAAQRGFRIFYLGSRPGVAERGAELLRAEIPGLAIATHHGYLPDAPGHPEHRRVLDEIGRFHTDILMVGMGMPRQEHWIVDHLDEIPAHAILTSGACMDYVAGEVATPPRWMGRTGLEWLYRLGSEPGRLWRRYLVEPWRVLGFALRRRSAQIRGDRRGHVPRQRGGEER
jgi:N-acetylglucosaminyldiphosphoundecaprenol N-acetyl-beta-D-mannosaminyltransferase